MREYMEGLEEFIAIVEKQSSCLRKAENIIETIRQNTVMEYLDTEKQKRGRRVDIDLITMYRIEDEKVYMYECDVKILQVV